ncbi:hypothetical protein KPH14_008866 [Odynerus spinipes]|uniref:Uncharacterized protein n=1 Tax=Odynerus spinipes TaxID=1348599 RepID=A0AAD9RFE6_9HYME|nr:hypothetical protein KPH14_008866 [Odynerus spinipes]
MKILANIPIIGIVAFATVLSVYAAPLASPATEDKIDGDSKNAEILRNVITGILSLAASTAGSKTDSKADIGSSDFLSGIGGIVQVLWPYILPYVWLGR